MTEEITIVIEWTGSMQVLPGKQKGAIAWFSAPGLIIHKRGSAAKYYDRFCNLAVNEAISRHIPAMSLRRIEK